jgi:Flp pilus assembly protein TadG
MNRQRITSERGQTMVEFALVAPVLCLLLFAIIQFGVLYSSYVTLTDATRAGARKAAVSRLESQPAVVAEAAVRNSAANLHQTCTTANQQLCVSVAVSGGVWEHGKDVTVEATYPYEIDLMGLVFKKGRLKSTTTERVE